MALDIFMTTEEAKKKLLEGANNDLENLSNMIEEFRRDTGIPVGILIECLILVAHNYKLAQIAFGESK